MKFKKSKISFLSEILLLIVVLMAIAFKISDEKAVRFPASINKGEYPVGDFPDADYPNDLIYPTLKN